MTSRQAKLQEDTYFRVNVLTPTGMAEKASITHRFLQRKMDEYAALKAEIEALKSEVEKPGGEGSQKA